MRIILVSILLIFSNSIFSQNIIVDDQRTAQNLIENVLFNNTGCATVSNFSVSGGNFGTNENSYAYFNGNNSSFPFSDGIVLSTGKAINTVGPNNTLSDDDAIGWLVDADLESVLGTSSTLNATILEFDFTPKSTFLSFDYIFASEEYQEGNPNTCIYSDVFAFLIKPVGGVYENIAVVPNTSTPVSVTTVHPEITGGCSAENENYFGSWNDATAPINFNGQTAILTARKDDLVINQQYHIKLVIADHINYRYDSAVFLKANSFNVGIDLGIDRLITTNNALCGNESLYLDAIINANSYQWSKYNTTTLVFDDLLGEINQTFTINSTLGAGIYRVEADLGTGCILEGEIVIEYNSFILNDTQLRQCINNNSQIANFNLFDSFSEINNGDATLVIEGFYNNLINASSEINVIPNPDNYANVSQDEMVIVRVRNTSGCVNYAEIILKVYQNPIIRDDASLFYCLSDFPNKIILESGFLEGVFTDYTYQWYQNNNLLLGETSHNFETNQEGEYVVEITNSDNCTVSRTITVKNSEIAVFENVLVTENQFYPNLISIIIEVSGLGDYQYAIDIDPLTINDADNYQDLNVFEGLVYGKHILYIRDKNGCGVLIKQILLLKYPKFITPNNDGNYDSWNINNIHRIANQFNTISAITIYNRLGKIMAIINPFGLGWDGTYNGEPVQQTDYWFTVQFIDFNGKVFLKEGHFSLER